MMIYCDLETTLRLMKLSRGYGARWMALTMPVEAVCATEHRCFGP